MQIHKPHFFSADSLEICYILRRNHREKDRHPVIKYPERERIKCKRSARKIRRVDKKGAEGRREQIEERQRQGTGRREIQCGPRAGGTDLEVVDPRRSS